MPIPLELDFGTLEPSPMLAGEIRRRLTRLERYYGRAQSCHVTVAAPHRHQGKVRQFQVHIRLKVPGRTLVVSHDAGDKGHEDSYVAVRDAFNALRRQLEDYSRILQGETRTFVTRQGSGPVPS
jgi:ribosome-associated translation inhibitor RaiA